MNFKVIGKKGTVEEVDEDGDVQVGFGGYTWTFNPECLSPTDGKPDIVNYTDKVPSELRPPVGEQLTHYNIQGSNKLKLQKNKTTRESPKQQNRQMLEASYRPRPLAPAKAEFKMVNFEF